MNKHQKRKCILHLSAPLDNFYSSEFWKGASDEALKLGYNFISLSGGLQVSWLNGIEIYSRVNEVRSTLMYQMPDKSMFDGIVMWGAQMMHDAAQKTIQSLVDYFSPLPIVSVGWEGKGVTSLNVDNYSGIKELVLHLIQVHEHKNIAFLKNDTAVDNSEFAERYKAFCDALNESHISVKEDLIIEGAVIQESLQRLNSPYISYSWSVLAIQELIDNRKLVPGKDFTALIARDDTASLGAIEELVRRGYKVPEDVAVIGFDNIIEGRCSSPPLTTVSQSFREQGAAAVRKLVSIFNNNTELHSESISTTRVIIRESCGCTNRFAKNILETESKSLNSCISRDLRNAGMKELLELSKGGRRANDISRSVNTAAKTFCEAGEDPMEIIHLVEEMAQNGAINQNTRTAADVLAGDIAQRLQLMEKIKAEKRRETLDAIDQSIFASYDINVILPSIESELPALGASSCYIVLYEDPLRPDKNGKILLAYINGVHKDIQNDEAEPFPVSRILPETLLAETSEPYSLFIQSLHFGSRRIGYLILQDEGSDGRSFSSLALRLSGALEGALLVNDLNKKRQELEKAYEEILSLSNQDSLTHLSNRRDFERELQVEHRRMIRQEQPEEHSYSLLFIDLDNFKFYNDTFGHDVGDAALIAFARFLPTCVRITDIVARYGGDEFICLLPDTPMEGAVIVAERILKTLKQMGNLLAETQTISGMKLDVPEDKLLYCSIGIASQEGSMNPDELVKTADEGLYLAKKNGKGCWKTSQKKSV
ncbi:MAG TPA: GGDEF domain-containing protein [Treponemataceae bacterium]|nr:GGDEF domain-containing protein [Treponemataceae bacterium]